MTARMRCFLALFAAVALAGPAWAGPPYVTDDPAPTDPGHWEIYNFIDGDHVPGVTAGEAGFDLNYGAAKDVQLTLVLPAAYSDDDRFDLGGVQIEAAAKFKLLHEDGFGLDVAVFPRAFIPTDTRFDTGHVNVLLPVWVGKDLGAWQVFGGGGYQINPGPGQRSFWTGGLALTRDVTKQLNLGAEVYAHTADAAPTTAIGRPRSTSPPVDPNRRQRAKSCRTLHRSLLRASNPPTPEGFGKTNCAMRPGHGAAHGR